MMDDKKPWEMDWGAPQSQPTNPASPPPVVYGAPQDPLDRQYKQGQVAGQGRDVTNDALSNKNTTSEIANRDRSYNLNRDQFNRQSANTMRDDYDKSPSVTTFLQARNAYMAGLQTAPNPGGDLSLIYAYAKMMDPATGVREGEAASVANSQPFIDATVANLSKQLGDGGSFSDRMRSQLRQEMFNKMQAMAQGYGMERDRYTALAKRAGLDPQDVVDADLRTTYADLEKKAFSGRRGDIGIDKDGNISFSTSPTTEGGGNGGGGGDKDSGDTLGAYRDLVAGVADGRYTISQNGTAKVRAPGDNGEMKDVVLPDSILNSDWYRAVYAKKFGTDPKLMVSINVPQDELASNYEQRLRGLNAKIDKADGTESDAKVLATSGFAQQFRDELAGGAAATGEFLRTGDTARAGRAYNLQRDAENLRIGDARKRQGKILGGAEELGGAMLLPVGRAGEVPASAMESGSLATASRYSAISGAKTGAKIGALSGAGASDPGVGNRLSGALTGAAGGAVAGGVLGGAAPAVGKYVVSPLAQAAKRAIGRDGDRPLSIVGAALADDAGGASGAAAKMDDAGTRGSPMMLADTGENARALLASASRRQGAGKTMGKAAVIDRQKAQMERISDAVRRDLGPTANIRDLGDKFIEKAKTDAAPLYDEAYSAPLQVIPGVEKLLNRPSMQSALGRAYRIAKEEGRNPNELGLIMDDAGNVTLRPEPVKAQGAVDDARSALSDAQAAYRAAKTTTGKAGDVDKARSNMMAARDRLRAAETTLSAQPKAGEEASRFAPSWQTLDYVKRGMDDVVESYRDKTTGKLVLDTEGRAVNNTLRTFLTRVDTANPAYATARGAYAGPASMKTAMDKGFKALNRSPDDLAAEMQHLTPSEQEMYRMGLRKAITDFLETKTDGADKVGALIGTPKRRIAFEKAFGGKAEFQRFISTLQDEEAMNLTYRKLNTGSPTSENLATDESIKPGVGKAVVSAGLKAAGGDHLGAIGSLVRSAHEARQFGVGKAGETTRDSIVAYLTESDPAVVRDLIREADRLREAGKFSGGKLVQGSKVLGAQVGRAVGGVVGPSKNLRP